MSKKKKKTLSERARDAPVEALELQAAEVSQEVQSTQERLPKIEDNVRDSGGVFVFGMTNSGELVNEKSALQISTVYACVRLLAETVASLPLHLYSSPTREPERSGRQTIRCIRSCTGRPIRR